MMRVLLLATALASLAPAAVHAANVTVTGYDTPDPDAFNAGTINGYNYYDGPIILHTSQGDIIAYCADLQHDLHAQDYTFGLLTTRGDGTPISAALSSRLGHLASAGFAAFQTNNDDLAAAVQLAIWSLEYNTTATNFANSTIAADFSLAESWSFQNTGYATELIPVGDWPADASLSQGMVVGFAAGAPEPSTWAMMLMGFAGLGYAAFRHGRKESLSRSIA
jgi:PEP-CTERM motif